MKALHAAKMSPLVCQCQQTSNNISARHAVGLYWVPDHAGVRKWNRWQARKERFWSAVYWAWTLFGGLYRQNIRRKMKNWMKNQHRALWRGPCSTQRQAQELISGPNVATGTRLLYFNRTQTRVIGLLTGHNTLRRHLHVMGPSNNHTCRKCGTEKETSLHILCKCEALASLRHIYLGSFFGPRGY